MSGYLMNSVQDIFGPLANSNPDPINWDLVYDKEDDDAVDEAMRFVFDAGFTGNTEALDAAWKSADVSRLDESVMVTLLCVTCLHPREIYKERAGFILRCKHELIKRGLSADEVISAFSGLE